jgi:hypothetical protein
MASSRDGASLVRRAREASKLFPMRAFLPVGALSRVDQMLERRVIGCVRVHQIRIRERPDSAVAAVREPGGRALRATRTSPIVVP